MGFALLDPGKPTIAAVNGWCLAGGVELACWCDLRIVAENARIGLLNKRWGLSLADGGTQRLARIVGLGNALWMIETGIEIDAHRARLIGQAQEVVPAGQALDRAMELARHIASYPQVGIRADRRAAIEGFGLPLAEGLQLEVEVCHPPVRAPEVLAGMASFVSGKPGNRRSSVPPPGTQERQNAEPEAVPTNRRSSVPPVGTEERRNWHRPEVPLASGGLSRAFASLSVGFVGDQRSNSEQKPGDADSNLAPISLRDASDDEEQAEHQQQRPAYQKSPHGICLSLPTAPRVSTAIIAPRTPGTRLGNPQCALRSLVSGLVQ
jgi:Enoyl-CoA hydratase/isomerase